MTYQFPRSEIIHAVVEYCTSRGIRETTVGQYALRDTDAVARLREGRLSLRCAERLFNYVTRDEAAN